jgi:hypothetical protein
MRAVNRSTQCTGGRPDVVVPRGEPPLVAMECDEFLLGLRTQHVLAPGRDRLRLRWYPPLTDSDGPSSARGNRYAGGLEVNQTFRTPSEFLPLAHIATTDERSEITDPISAGR